MDRGLNQAWWALRIGLGLGPFLAGLDKFFNVLANWEGYVSPLATKVLPISAVSLMHVVGVIEMIVGLAILTKFTRVFAYVAAVWLLAIAVNLLTTGHYFDIAVRDTLLALSAFTLGRLSEARAKVPVTERAVAPSMRPAASHA